MQQQRFSPPNVHTTAATLQPRHGRAARGGWGGSAEAAQGAAGTEPAPIGEWTAGGVVEYGGIKEFGAVSPAHMEAKERLRSCLHADIRNHLAWRKWHKLVIGTYENATDGQV